MRETVHSCPDFSVFACVYEYGCMHVRARVSVSMYCKCVCVYENVECKRACVHAYECVCVCVWS